MARLSRFVGVIAVICIVLILLFLTVKEVGRFTTHLGVSSLRAQRALPEEISLVAAILVVIILISCKARESESGLASSELSSRSIPTNPFLSALRC